MDQQQIPPGFQEMLSFGLVEALLGRRSRRFFMGAEIPDGVMTYKSRHQPEPLSELEKMLVVTACGGNTGWHHMIYRAQRYAPHLSNYAGAAGGRTFPSAAGFHTSKTFFTDDDGVYVLDVRDEPAPNERQENGKIELEELVTGLKKHVSKLQDGRLKLPSEVPFVEAHNTWVVNKPGTLLVMPVGDLAQHVLLALCYMLQNGQVLYDDINKQPIPGIEQFKDLVDTENVLPLSFTEQLCLGELAVEVGTSCYAGALLLQAMGLGGWMFDGIDPFALLGASGNPDVPGLGFRFDTNEKWAVPNVTGLKGILEGFCPPHYKDMRSAVDAVCHRKYGPGGPFNKATPGPWQNSGKVRSAAEVHSERFKECVALQAQYIYDTFGKFPATVPSIYTQMFLQAQHIDLDFYNHFYKPGEYLHTHADHFKNWHPDKSK